MIFEINLLKDRAKAQKKKSFLRVILYVELFLFGLSFLLLGYHRSILYYKAENTQKTLAMLNEDIIFLSKEGATLTNLREINDKYAEITAQLVSINKLIEDRVLFSYKLKGISKIIPDDVWVSRLNIEEATQRKKGQKDSKKIKLLSLSGFVMAEREEAFEKIQSFIKDLEKEPLFSENIKNIKLSYISRPQSRFTESVTEFNIKCQISN